jgi:hypothetical protein
MKTIVSFVAILFGDVKTKVGLGNRELRKKEIFFFFESEGQ